MKIISWNVNGLRAVVKKNMWEQIFEFDPDIVCLQETKAHPDQLPEDIKNPTGHLAYFDHSKTKKGYSGVAIFVKKNLEKRILKIEYGLGAEKYDQEGRFLAVFFDKFVLINCYFPNGGGGPDRLKFKLEYYEEFLKYIERVRKNQPNIIFCGDVNTAHAEIDLARPKENINNTGFLPIERAWIDKIIKHGYVDVFRAKNPDKKDAYTYWDMKTFSRERNIGWRIDYFFASKELFSKAEKMEILDRVLGSDHCPISIDLDI